MATITTSATLSHLCYDTVTTAVPSYDCSISRYIDGSDVYINGVRLKDYIDNKIADSRLGLPDLNLRRFKVVMGSL